MAFDITWIGQGGFILTLGDKKLCIDPYLSNSLKAFNGFDRIIPIPIEPKDLKVDMIVCTHDHIDHLDEVTLKYTDTNSIIYSGPDSCVRHFNAIGIPQKNIAVLNRGQSVRLGDAVVYGVYAEHTMDSIGIVVEYQGISIYVVGDSLYDNKLIDVKSFNPDIILCCINGRLGNMNYVEAGALARKINVKTAVPCHYGMFKENTEDPIKFKEALEGSRIKYFEMNLNKLYDVKYIL